MKSFPSTILVGAVLVLASGLLISGSARADILYVSNEGGGGAIMKYTSSGVGSAFVSSDTTPFPFQARRYGLAFGSVAISLLQTRHSPVRH